MKYLIDLVVWVIWIYALFAGCIYFMKDWTSQEDIVYYTILVTMFFGEIYQKLSEAILES